MIDNHNSYLAGPTVKVVVGEDAGTTPQSFSVHADLLTSRSTFFSKALRNYTKMYQGTHEADGVHSVEQQVLEQQVQWQEGEEGVVKLPVDEPDVFAKYGQLLYSGALPIFDDPQKPDMGPSIMTEEEVKKLDTDFRILVENAVEKMYTMLEQLYVFCEKIQDTTAKQSLLVSFIKECSKTRATGSCYYPEPLVIKLVYSGTPTSDPLREFLVDGYLYAGKSSWVGEDCIDLPRDFLYQFMVGTFQTRPAPKDRSRLRDTKYYLEKLNAPEIREKEEDTEMRMEVE
jgi:hypothetical protein